MSRKRVLTDGQCEDLEAWYSNYLRIGTIEEKCKEAGISRDAFMDAIARIRGQDLRHTRKKISQAELNQIVDAVPRGTAEVV